MRFRATLAAFTILAPLLAAAQADPAKDDWVERSNLHAQVMVEVRGTFQPEFTSFFGVHDYDERVFDLGPRIGERYRAALRQAQAELQRRLATERDPNVRQDLDILIGAAAQEIEGSELNERYRLPWFPLMQAVFFGHQALLQPQVDDARRPAALVRLKRYTGLAEGSESIFAQARHLFDEKKADTGLLGPVRLEVEREIADVPALVAGIRTLFEQFEFSDAEEALVALERQADEYTTWLREDVLPRSRDDFRLPPELYAFQLKQVGVDLDPRC